jgi:hypothetical protein
MWRSKVKSIYKSPFSIDLGIESNLNDETILFGKISFFSRVRKYEILKNLDENYELPEFIDQHIDGFTNMMFAKKPVVNIAVALQHHFSSKIEFLFGARTDFNPLDRDEINVYNGNYPGQTYWDIFHLTGGVIWGFEKLDLSIGGDYSFGLDRKTRQFVNLTEPTDENFLFGVPNNTANVRYNQINISLGVIYFFKEK